MILPTGVHGLRSRIESAFACAGRKLTMVAEIDSLATLMDAVDSDLS
jgi:LysR family tcuABC transcriptional regulator